MPFDPPIMSGFQPDAFQFGAFQFDLEWPNFVQGSPFFPVNAALTGTATASSTFSTAYPASSAINGSRTGGGWSNAANPDGWNSAGKPTVAAPQWLQVEFPAAQYIGKIDVITLQNGYLTAPPIIASSPSGVNGIKDYQVETWDGSAWVTIPGMPITGNILAWRTFTFTPIMTTKIRVVVTAGNGGYARIVELEAWTAEIGGTIWDAALTLGAAAGWSDTVSAQFYVSAGFPAASGFSDAGNGQMKALTSLSGSAGFAAGWGAAILAQTALTAAAAVSSGAVNQLLAALALSSGVSMSPAETAQLAASISLSSGVSLSAQQLAVVFGGLNLSALAVIQAEYPGAVAYLLRMLLTGSAPKIKAVGH